MVHCTIPSVRTGLRSRSTLRPDPERAQREAQDERGEHQLEGVRRAAQHQGEHADPVDLVDERGDGGPEAGEEEQRAQRLGRQPAGVHRRGRLGGSRGAPIGARVAGRGGDHDEGAERDDEVQHRRDQQRAGQARERRPGRSRRPGRRRRRRGCWRSRGARATALTRRRSRSTPALMSGKVAPSRTDCGRISALAMLHLATVSSGGPASIG